VFYPDSKALGEKTPVGEVQSPKAASLPFPSEMGLGSTKDPAAEKF